MCYTILIELSDQTGGRQMQYLSVADTVKKWNISERSVRNYCAKGRVPVAFLTGKT